MANRLPERPDPTRLPAERTLTQEQFEMVIRRAAELQARAAEEPGGGGLTEAEAIRIGREIGISPSHLRRALAETSGQVATAPSTGVRLFGPDWVHASRTVPGKPGEVKDELDRYLINRERLAPIRRFAERTTYAKARGNELARIVQLARETLMSRKQQPLVGAGFQLRKAREVEVVVQPLEEGYSYVTLGADLGNMRTGLIVAGASTGGGIALATAVVLGLAVDPAAALIGAPILPGTMWGTRALQIRTAVHAQTHLESILDCLERSEPLVLERY
jgi:hypothetical protein